METKSEQKMSLSFLLLAIYVFFTISNTFNIFIRLFDPRVHALATGRIVALVTVLVALVKALVPIALIILLYLNKKKDIKKIAQIVLLVAGIVNCYSVFRNISTIFRYNIGGMSIHDWMPQLYSTIFTLVLCIVQIMGFLSLISNQKNKKIEMIAKVGCIIYLILVVMNMIVTQVSIWGVVLNLLLIMGISCFPDTIIDYSSAKMAKGNIVKIAIAMVVVFAISSTIMGGSSNACRSCHRTFTDSKNQISISRTGMCSNCAGNYKIMQDILGD